MQSSQSSHWPRSPLPISIPIASILPTIFQGLSAPTRAIAVMGPEGAANIIFRKEIKEAADPNAKRQEKIDEYRQNFSNPYQAAKRGFVDLVINPKDTRPTLVAAFEMAATKREPRPRKKHGNIPL